MCMVASVDACHCIFKMMKCFSRISDIKLNLSKHVAHQVQFHSNEIKFTCVNTPFNRTMPNIYISLYACLFLNPLFLLSSLVLCIIGRTVSRAIRLGVCAYNILPISPFYAGTACIYTSIWVHGHMYIYVFYRI